jgi:hypothetical protein
MSYRRLRAMFIKELHHVTRDSRSLAMALAMPMMMLLLYGYALSSTWITFPTLVYDQDGTSRQPRPGAPVSGLAAISTSSDSSTITAPSSTPSIPAAS